MSEALTKTVQSQEAIAIDNELASRWIANDQSVWDKQYDINRGNGSEQVNLYDVVQFAERGEDGNRTGNSYPIVIFINSQGVREEAKATDFLTWRGLTRDEVIVEIDECQKVEIAEQVGNQVLKAAFSELAGQQKAEREAEIFAPLAVKDTTEEPTNYDFLLNPDVEPDWPDLAPARRESNKYSFTDESEATALDRLTRAMKSDQRLKEIVTSFAVNNGMDDFKNVTRAIREDKDLRLSLGRHFLDRINDNLHNMPPRINQNLGKTSYNPDHKKFGTLRSREYAALLSLSMVDGTFRDDLVRSDSIDYGKKLERNEQGGQHRYAAMITLGLDP